MKLLWKYYVCSIVHNKNNNVVNKNNNEKKNQTLRIYLKRFILKHICIFVRCGQELATWVGLDKSEGNISLEREIQDEENVQQK